MTSANTPESFDLLHLHQLPKMTLISPRALQVAQVVTISGSGVMIADSGPSYVTVSVAKP